MSERRVREAARVDAAWRHAARAGIGLLAIALAATGCASTPQTATPGPTPTPTPTAAPTAAATLATAPPGTSMVDVPEAGIALPVPSAWETIGAAPLSDPAVRAELAATYPGAAELLAAVDELNGRAEPAFIAVDPAAAGSDGPLAANLSVLVAQPSVGGPLLDLVAGFICDSLTDALGAPGSPERERERLPIGDAVRCTYDLPTDGGEPLVAEAWVIGAPSATVLVTLLGPAAATHGVTARAIVEAITPLSQP